MTSETKEQAQARRRAQEEKRRLAAERQAEYEAAMKHRKSSTSGISPIPTKTKKTMTKAEKRILAAQRMENMKSPYKAPKKETPKKKVTPKAEKENQAKPTKSVAFVKPATPTKIIFKDGQNKVSKMIAKWEQATNIQEDENEADVPPVHSQKSTVEAAPVVKVHMTALIVGFAFYAGLLFISWNQHQSTWIQLINNTDFHGMIQNVNFPSLEKVTLDEWAEWTKATSTQSVEFLKEKWAHLSQETIMPAVESIKDKFNM